MTNILKTSIIETPLGEMLVVSNDEKLYLLDFKDRKTVAKELTVLQKSNSIIPGETAASRSIKKELKQYLNGELTQFTTPMQLQGSEFQKRVWQALIDIPSGETRSYADIAQTINQPKAYRAVARANGSNRLAIIIPCHRVIQSNGELGGYGGGVPRKQWLLNHEFCSKTTLHAN
jgi:AraC family transcriptional regulator, regulatory protein of adaptative response / methylated-DNA-[protein]-cysteine methyltransferase